MDSKDGAEGSRSNTPGGGGGGGGRNASGDDDGFLQSPRTGPPSIISSRMTDIGTEDGKDLESSAQSTQRQSLAASQPGSIRTNLSAQRKPAAWPQNQALRRGLSKRGSGVGSIGGSSGGGRPASSTSRSHVPSVSSHAFFRPMSSQKLQAQRGVTRPSNMNRQESAALQDMPAEDVSGIVGVNIARSSITSNPVLARQFTVTDDEQLPPSRGTEMTDQNTYDQQTANTSPNGHNAQGSMSESVRPLQKKKRGEGLSVQLDKSYKNGTGVPSPSRTPRSFRSSFLLPGRSNGENGSNRSMSGGRKLDSIASSPRFDHDGDGSTDQRPDTAVTKPARSKLGQNFEYFEGNTTFCLGGRLQNTKARPVNIATGAFVVIPCILFFVFSARDLWYDVSPAVPIIFAYLAFICVSSFLHASGSDPGILPRNLHQNPPADVNEDPLRLAPPSTDWTLIKSAESSTAAMEVPTKYCKTCHIWRPPRTHHCRMCDNCVETADHHCVWLNNCVGRRNYRYFFAFVSSATFIAAYLVGASLAQILVYKSKNKVTFQQAINHDPVPFAMVIYGFVGFLYPAALMGYHIFLMARGETTREFLNSHKFLKKDRYRAFTQGNWARNWLVVLCRPRPPTYYRFKKQYVEGDQRLGIRTSERRKAAGDDQTQGMELQDVPSTGFQGPVSLRNNSNAAQQQA